MLSLVKALPGIWNVTVLVSIFWLIFSILGVSLFKGKLQSCQNPDPDANPDPAFIVLDKDLCLEAGGLWLPDPNISFDSELQALSALCNSASLYLARVCFSVALSPSFSLSHPATICCVQTWARRSLCCFESQRCLAGATSHFS